MFVFVVSVKPSSTTKGEFTIQLPEKYRQYVDVFDKVRFLTSDCIIAPSIYNREKRHHGDRSTICHQPSQKSFEAIQRRIGKRFHLTFKILSRHTHFLRQEKRWLTSTCCRLLWLEQGYNKKQVCPSPYLKFVERINGARFFRKIDLRGAYNLVRIRPGDKRKTVVVWFLTHDMKTSKIIT